MTGRAEHSGDVVDLLTAARGGDDIIERRELSHAHVDAESSKPVRFRRLAHERAHVLSLSGEPPGEMPAGEARGSGDEDGSCHDGIARNVAFGTARTEQGTCL
jgi:hypothetical protein